MKLSVCGPDTDNFVEIKVILNYTSTKFSSEEKIC